MVFNRSARKRCPTMFVFVFFFRLVYRRVHEFIVLFCFIQFDYVLWFMFHVFMCVVYVCVCWKWHTIECNSKLMGKIKPVNGTMTQPSEYRTHAITKPTENAAKKCYFWTPILDVVYGKCKQNEDNSLDSISKNELVLREKI